MFSVSNYQTELVTMTNNRTKPDEGIQYSGLQTECVFTSQPVDKIETEFQRCHQQFWSQTIQCD